MFNPINSIRPNFTTNSSTNSCKSKSPKRTPPFVSLTQLQKDAEPEYVPVPPSPATRAKQTEGEALSHLSKLFNVPDYVPFRFARTANIYRVNPKKERVEMIRLKSPEEYEKDRNNPDLKDSHKTWFVWEPITSVLTAYNMAFNPQRVHQDIPFTFMNTTLMIEWCQNYIKWIDEYNPAITHKYPCAAIYDGFIDNIVYDIQFKRENRDVTDVNKEHDKPLFIFGCGGRQEYYYINKYSDGPFSNANEFADGIRHGETWKLSTIMAYLEWKSEADKNGWATE